MMKTNVFATLMAVLVLFCASCSEKETPQPVEDTARIDQLRNELRAVQEMIYGVQLENDLLTSESEDLAALQSELEAEIASLQEQYNRAVTYTVIALDNLGNPIPAASVTVNQNGTLVTKTTDESGAVQIENVRAGTVAAVVKATGYATVNYYASLAFANAAGVNTRIVMIPKGGAANTYTLQGFLYANTNVANDTASGFHYSGTAFVGWKGTDAATKEPGAAGDNRTYEKVNKKITATLYVDIDYVPFSRATGDGGNSADLIELAYEDASVEAVFDANNQYSLVLPVTSIYKDAWGDNVEYWWDLSFEEFVADQTLVDYDPAGATLGGGAPRSAWPMPSTYKVKRLFRMWDSDDGSDYGDRDAGDVVTEDFYYSAYTF
ncbi:MAG: carboxypeptidase-like regulatory domain-containing protein [Chryseosolibacter sp.]